MGVDLKLLIVDGRMGPNAGFSHSMMEFGREYGVFDNLKAVARTIPGFVLSGYLARIPDGSWKGECGYGDVTETPYGEPLTYVSAAEFLEATEGYDRRNRWAKACIAYVRELPLDTWIGLYYH